MPNRLWDNWYSEDRSPTQEFRFRSQFLGSDVLLRIRLPVAEELSQRQYLVKESGEWRQNEIQIDYENLLKNFRRRTHGF
ncbi:hypothetical protein QUA44_04955 [Microcoleus sp. N9_A2]|uniref:hypothetical protein n=1 Tax=unclassified Microcoleus TaxID=2642155 RepID=UPI002FD2F19E